MVGDCRICRDPNDDIVIETAIRGRVEVLVSSDKDILEDANVVALLAAAGVRVLKRESSCAIYVSEPVT